MDTLVKIPGTTEGKRLLTYLKSLSFVKVVGNSESFINVAELKEKVKKAEKSKSLSIEDAMQKSSTWKNKYRHRAKRIK